MNAWRQADILLRGLDGIHGLPSELFRRLRKRPRAPRGIGPDDSQRSEWARGKLRKGAERNLRALDECQKICFSASGFCWTRRVHFQDNVVLIELRENRGILALAKCVVQSVVDHLRQIPRRDAVSRSIVMFPAAAILLVAGDVMQLRQGCQPYQRASEPKRRVRFVRVLPSCIWY